MKHSFQPAITAVVLSAALVLLATLPSSAGIGDGRHLVRNLSNNGANNLNAQISGSNVVWRGNADGNNDIYAAYWLGPDAVLNNVDLSGEDLSDLDFSAVDLQTVVGLGATVGNALYSPATFFPSGFDPVSQGWTLVPEPHTLLLASLASMGLTLRRRRWAR